MGLVAPFQNEDVPPKSESGDTLITPNDIATAVKDTFINRTAIATEVYPNLFGTLLSYTEGTPVIVEYFKKRGPFINNQTIDTSFSMERASVHFSFDLIHNFEIRIKDQLEIATDQETTEITINGAAIIYPGFKPNVGDMFYMKLPDNNIGVFVINLTEPLSIFRGTHYQINFHFDSFLNTSTDEKMRACVSDELWFEKQSYFNGETTLLSDTSYNQLEELVRYRKAIISRLMNNFYNVSEKTIIRPDKVYDPYLVEYLMNKISVTDSRRELCALPDPYVSNFDNTIWNAYLNQDVTQLLFTGYTLHVYQQFLFDVGISNIDQYRLVSLIDPERPFDALRMIPAKFYTTDSEFRTVSYIFSGRFYYALLKSFEESSDIINIVPRLSDMINDDRIYEDLNKQFYSTVDHAYHDISFFDTHSKQTGSNNDLHIPELEYILYDFILHNNIDIPYLLEKVLAKFPFINMEPIDQLYMSSMLLNVIDASVPRIR